MQTSFEIVIAVVVMFNLGLPAVFFLAVILTGGE